MSRLVSISIEMSVKIISISFEFQKALGANNLGMLLLTTSFGPFQIPMSTLPMANKTNDRQQYDEGDQNGKHRSDERQNVQMAWK